MVEYPIKVLWKYYKGSKEPLRSKVIAHNRLASKLEDYVNRKIEKEQEYQVQSYTYASIAFALNLPLKTVHDVLFRLDCGSTGFTVFKKGAPKKNWDE